MDFSDKMHCSGMGFREYIEALEIERKKIQVFERELPLCLELVNQTIDKCKQQLSGTTTTTEYLHGHSECSGQTSSEAHRKTTEKDNKKKADWLRSVQLWNNPTPDPPQKELELPKKASVVEVKRNGGAFQPFQRVKKVEKGNGSSSGCTAPVATAPATSSNDGTITGGSGKREEQKEGQTQRKQRRNWSPELHKRFLNALQQLGGSHAATPKQIRELMKVDGLTNDEVKSHLQKYRLHTRRPTPAIHNNGNTQTPQVVFVGGIWMQPSEYAAAVATATGGAGDPSSAAANGVYAPVAAPPPAIQHIALHRSRQNKQSSEPSHSEERVMSHSEGGLHSNSPATSSSTHTTTTSPAF
ncbi:GARP transcription factor [Parasponia andersonii]|uniref:GARP transcription factor n=1 Tax=Parasponia andersonii TaxID=3476 RepID=A0A2P5CEP4_PARAD|nr:GARP transcription factor [Parasponia andersonii]